MMGNSKARRLLVSSALAVLLWTMLVAAALLLPTALAAGRGSRVEAISAPSGAASGLANAALAQTNGISLTVNKELRWPTGGVVDVGDIATFTIRILNSGDTTINSLWLTDVFSECWSWDCRASAAVSRSTAPALTTQP